MILQDDGWSATITKAADARPFLKDGWVVNKYDATYIPEAGKVIPNCFIVAAPGYFSVVTPADDALASLRLYGYVRGTARQSWKICHRHYRMMYR